MINYPRVLGIDVGTKKIGIALSDFSQKYVSKTWVIKINACNYKQGLNILQVQVHDYIISTIVVGYPFHINEQTYESLSQQAVKQFMALLPTYFPKAFVIIVNEACTTKYAQILQKTHKIANYKSKNNDDAIAASLILECGLTQINK